MTTNDLEKTLRLLGKATTADDAPADRLDPETASLREAWLAFGELLEAVQPGDCPNFHVNENETVPFGAHARPRRQRLLAAGLLAASLLVGAVTVWMLYGARQENPAAEPEQMAATNRQDAPSTQARAKNASTADEPQWDDSLDEQFAHVGWQMACVRQNQLFRTDAFGMVQYRMEQFRQTIQTDSL
jgi:hypothetical protein